MAKSNNSILEEQSDVTVATKKMKTLINTGRMKVELDVEGELKVIRPGKDIKVPSGFIVPSNVSLTEKR